MTPEHLPREDTPEYRKSHDFLINQMDYPCVACGVKKSTLHDPGCNPYGAKQLESHHAYIEYSLQHCCDVLKVHKRFPQVIDEPTLAAFVDSPVNLIVVCDICHRSPERGIHHLLVQDWNILPFLKTGYRLVATAQDEAAALAVDEAIESQEKGG
jgi:hypothetical protein